MQNIFELKNKAHVWCHSVRRAWVLKINAPVTVQYKNVLGCSPWMAVFGPNTKLEDWAASPTFSHPRVSENTDKQILGHACCMLVGPSVWLKGLERNPRTICALLVFNTFSFVF